MFAARALLGALCACLLLAAQAASAADRIDAIRARGHLGCGIDPGVAGFAVDRGGGRYAGFDVDLCRAVAAAIFGDPDRVRFFDAMSVENFLATSDIDMVARRLTWTLTREGANGVLFGPIVFYDGQGFLVRKSLGATGARDLAHRRVCVEPGEGWEGNLARFSRANGLDLRPVVIADHAAVMRAFLAGRCDAYSADVTMLGSERSRAPAPDALAILPQMISKEPLAPLVRQGDDRFFALVRWTIFAMIEAEELGVTPATAAAMLKSRNPDVRLLLGATPGNGKALGVDERWAYWAVSRVGNYGELFDRDLGKDSPVKLARGLNRLWTDGGLLYAPPVR